MTLTTKGGQPVTGTAIMSPDAMYRYQLTREWQSMAGATGRVCWIMLNPSTADAYLSDPTITRCVRFTERWGYSSLVVVNLFALRATDPDALLDHPDPVGPANDEAIMGAVISSSLVIAAWGSPIPKRLLAPRVQFVRGAGRLHHLGLTADGQPRHPLYLKQTTMPEPW